MIGHRLAMAVLLLTAVSYTTKGRDYNIVDYGAIFAAEWAFLWLWRLDAAL